MTPIENLKAAQDWLSNAEETTQATSVEMAQTHALMALAGYAGQLARHLTRGVPTVDHSPPSIPDLTIQDGPQATRYSACGCLVGKCIHGQDPASLVSAE